MIGDSRMFNSINENNGNGVDSITFGDNGKGKVKGLGKIVVSNDLSISIVLLVESLNFNLLSVAQLILISTLMISTSSTPKIQLKPILAMPSRNVRWYSATFTEQVCKRTEIPL
jgi:hypothetical protein